MADDASPVEAIEETLEALLALGVPRARAEQAIAEDRVALTLVEILTEAGRVHTAEDVARAAGVPVPLLRRWEEALGLPPVDRYRDTDLEHARALGAVLKMLPPGDVDGLLRHARSDGEALTRIALSSLELVHERYVAPVRESGGDDVAVALSLAEAANALLPLAPELIGAGYRRVLERLLSSELVAATARAHEADPLTLSVGFVDVVGYTSLSARIDPDGLDEVLEAFETRCFTAVGTSEGVQLVKFLGDAAMLVSVDPVALAGVLLKIVEAPDPDSPLASSPMRAGMAHGEVLTRRGDYFGTSVNVAARLTDRARAGSVVADEALRPVLDEHFSLRRLPPQHLRGLGYQRPVRVRLHEA